MFKLSWKTAAIVEYRYKELGGVGRDRNRETESHGEGDRRRTICNQNSFCPSLRSALNRVCTVRRLDATAPKGYAVNVGSSVGL